MESIENEERRWANIEKDLLNKIQSYLLPIDRVRLASTCKSYQSVFQSHTILPYVLDESLSLLPTSLFFSAHKFYNPLDNAIYQSIADFEDVRHAVIRDANYGWFLMTQCWSDIFFYNPVTRVRIDLPDLPDISDGNYRASLHFTSPPTSTDCQVMGISPIYSDGAENIGICTVKRSRGSWTIREFSMEEEFSFSSCKPILYDGMYYCLGEYGNVMKYDPSNNTGCCNEIDEDIAAKIIDYTYVHRFMVESDGELLAVFVSQGGFWVQVFRLNVDKMVLEQISNLGNKVLYVSNAGSFSELAVEKGTGNKIYLPKFHGNNILFYSLDTNKFHSHTGYSSDHLYEAKYYGGSVWIRPSFDPICTQEYNW